MLAYAIPGFGSDPSLLELPVPTGDDHFLVRVSYAGMNPIDYKLAEMLSASSSFPFVFGIDFAGIVERIPRDDHGFAVGDRVFGMARTHGSYAQYTAIPANASTEPLARIPDDISDEQAAALPVAGVAALGSLELLGIGERQCLVVLGAAGGVVGFAVQLARARGAHVITTARGRPDRLLRLGADEVFDANEHDVFEQIHAAHPDGVDAVLDLVNGKDEIGRNAEIIKPGGKLVSTLRAADEAWFETRNVTAQNIFAQRNPKASKAGLDELAAAVASGLLDPRISFMTHLGNAHSALDRVRGGGLDGKAVVRMQVT